MHIDKTHGILGIRPVTLPERENKINRALFQRSQDIFTRSRETELSLEQSIESSYKKIETQLGIVNGKDVLMMAERLSRKLPSIPKEDILYTMGVLSQYSSYKSWEFFENKFDEIGVSGIYMNPIVEKNVTKGVPVCLTDVISYLSDKNCSKFLPKPERVNNAIILDSKLLSLMEKNPKMVNDLAQSDIIPIYIENFESGYNFLNQGESFEDFTFNVLKNCNEGDVKSELSSLLNDENLSRIEKLGIKPIIIKNDINNHPVDIAENLNPPMISIEEFSAELEKHTGDNIEKKVDILNTVGVFVSPRQYCENMKILHQKINKILQNNDIENVYYTIPDLGKSFSIANYIYQNINNVSDDKFINHDFKIKKSQIDEEMASFPEKFAVVVLDDVSATGSSLLNGPFYYVSTPKIKENSNKNMKIIITPMYSTYMAKREFDAVFEKNKPENMSDDFIMVKILPEYTRDMGKHLTDNPLAFYMGNDCLTSIVFPYMGPDTNDPRFFGIYEKLLYNPDSQKKI